MPTSIPDQTFSVTLYSENAEGDATINEWLEDNAAGRHYVRRIPFSASRRKRWLITYEFLESSDAVMFKLHFA